MVAFGEKVRIHYVGTLDDGTEFDNSRKRGEPLEFTVGAGRTLAGLERAALHMGLGETLSVRLSPSEGYGEHRSDLVERIPCELMPNWEKLPIGQTIVVRTQDGQEIRVTCAKIEDGAVFLDHNHPLAGKHLNFEIELIEIVRESAIEQESHGEGCACGCHKFKDAITRQNAKAAAAAKDSHEEIAEGASLEEILSEHGPREVRICDMDAASNQLIGEDGRRYEEVETNIWGPILPQGERRVLYLGTGKHGGGIILRALYVKTDDGAWANSTTGAPAPFPAERALAW